MKKLTSLLLALLLLFASMGSAAAATENIRVYLNGNEIAFDVPPQTINGRTMVPIRAIFEAMGATVNWDESTQTAICVKNGTTVKMTLNSTTEYINETAFEMDIAPVSIENRTLAPARYVAEAFGYTVGWDEGTQTVWIGNNNTNSAQSSFVVTAECKSALKKAETYSNFMHMSKARIYEQLTSEYGENFTAAEAQYAVDNLQADYKANALEKAKSYRDTMYMSKARIYEQLTSAYGEQFTAKEAQYAIDNLD